MPLRAALFGFIIATVTAAEEPYALPPVDVQLPPKQEAPLPESPTRRDAPAVHTVIKAKEHEGEAKNAAELITLSPGTVLSDAGGDGQKKTLSLRGAAPNGVLVLLDGTPISTQGGGADLSRIPLAIVDRFEVMRGGSSRYGAGGLGGVVNIVTKAPEDHRTARAELSFGAFSTQSVSLSASSGLGGGDALLVVHGLRTRGDFQYLFDDQPAFDGNTPYVLQRQNNDATQGGALMRYRRDVGRFKTEAVAELFADDRGLAGTVHNPTGDARGSSQRGLLTLRAQTSLSDDALLSVRGHALADRLVLQGGGFGAPSAQLYSSGGAEAVGEYFAGRHAFTFLISAGAESLAPRNGGDAASWAKGGVMVADDIAFFDGDLLLSPSVRVDQTGPFTTLSPKAGAVVHLPRGFSLRANGGQAHRAPSFLELYIPSGGALPNPSLRPERALFSDAQLAHETAITRVAVGGFYSLYEDLIAYELYPPALIKPFNIRTAHAYGLEAEASAQPHRLVSASAAYTLTFSQNLRDDFRYYLKDLPYRPRHKLSAGVYVGPEIFRGRVEVLAQSQQFINRTETLDLPSYTFVNSTERVEQPGRTFVNLGASSVVRAAEPRVTLSAEVKNVFDVLAADLDGYPLPGRAAYLSLAFALDEEPKGEGRP